jgi:hypothetical protein
LKLQQVPANNPKMQKKQNCPNSDSLNHKNLDHEPNKKCQELKGKKSSRLTLRNKQILKRKKFLQGRILNILTSFVAFLVES